MVENLPLNKLAWWCNIDTMLAMPCWLVWYFCCNSLILVVYIYVCILFFMIKMINLHLCIRNLKNFANSDVTFLLEWCDMEKTNYIYEKYAYLMLGDFETTNKF